MPPLLAALICTCVALTAMTITGPARGADLVTLPKLAASSSESSAPSPSPTATTGESPAWSTKTLDVTGGRKVFVMYPSCNGQRCRTPRKLILYVHGASSPEDQPNMNLVLNGWRQSKTETEAITAYAISRDGDKVFDAGESYCCTFEKRVPDVQYLVDAVDAIATLTPVDRTRVGLVGHSNGGMLDQKAVCERPDVFRVAASYAGTFGQETCTAGAVAIRQWHGTKDAVIPYAGGRATVRNHTFWVPPAASTGDKVGPESRYELILVEGAGHDVPNGLMHTMVKWVSTELG